MPKIVSSGRLVGKKGFDTLIKARSILRDREIEFSCEIVGNGPLEENLREQIATLDLESDVNLTGEYIHQEDIPALMNDADVFCLACQWADDNDVDGLPMMLMEAMACGTPVVSTDLVGIPDLVIDGETGLLVPPRDSQALAEAIEKLLKDPVLRENLGRAGRESVKADFDLGTCLTPLLARFRGFLTSTPQLGAD